MRRSTRQWWKRIVAGLGCCALATQLAVADASAEGPRGASAKRIPMRLASSAMQQPEGAEAPAGEEPAAPDPVPAPPERPQRPAAEKAPATREEYFEESEEYFDEPVDRADHHSRIWGPVWYGDCPPPRDLLGPMFDPCCNQRWWVNAEYLLWFQRGMSLPPLVTTSFQGTSLADAGVLGLATTSVLYGDQTIGDSSQSGARLTVGLWLDDCQYSGVGGRAFMLDTQNTTFDASNSTNSILARPYFDVTDGSTPQQNSLVIAYPGAQTGSVSVTSSADVSGGDFFLRRQIHSSHLSRVDFWLGYQYARITGDLNISSSSTDTSGASLDVFDQFSTRNEYHGVALGFLADIDRDRWSCQFLGKVGLGRMHQSASLSGSNTLTDGNTETTSPVGLLVRSTNSGMHANDDFSVSPEIGVTWKYHVTRNLDLSVGYSFIYWTKVLTPAGAIDPTLSANLAEPPTGAQNPAMAFNTTDYWLHGVSFGLGGRF